MSYGVYLAGTTDASSAANTGSTTPSATGSTTPGATGSTTPGNTGSAANHPPYITCYMWRRTA